MPFKKGLAPIRRTMKYIEASKLVLKDRVKVFSIHYNMEGENHIGAKDFVFWHLTQLQYKNPNVQVITFKDMTPTPFIRIFTENEEDILVDVDNKSAEEIHKYIKKIICKSDERLREEARKQEDNPGNFGWGCDRQCICEIPGQVPCPGVIPLPKPMRGKFKFNKQEDE